MTPHTTQSTPHRSRAFSLIELLVVIAIIAFLIALVLYGTMKVRQTTLGTMCMSNERQLMAGWISYATDNDGRYVAPDTNRHVWDWVRSVGANLQYDPSTGFYAEKESALTEGKLFSYIGDTKVYRSPLDDTGRVRNYSLSAFLTDGEGTSDWGGPPQWQIATISRIPKPAETINLVVETDYRGHNINGWGISPFNLDWIDKLAVFDPGYFNFAFADGHTERYKWAGTSYTVNETIEEAFSRNQTNVWYPGPDWDYVSARLFPGSRALYGDW